MLSRNVLIAVAAVVAAGAGTLALLSAWAPAIVVATTGVAAVLVLRPTHGEPGGSPLADAVRAAGLEGTPTHLPTGMWFVPDRPTDVVPPWDGVSLRVQGASPGAYMRAPGAHLLQRWIDTAGAPAGRGMEEAAAVVQAAIPGLGLGSRPKVSRHDERLRVRFRPRGIVPDDLLEAQAECPVLSLAAGLIAAATGHPTRLVAIHKDDAVTAEYEVLA